MTRHTTQAGPGSEFFPRTKFIQPPVAKESLVAWYPFRSGTGEDITAGDSRFGDTTDYSATVNGATYKPSGGVTDIQTGANSGAFEFDGTDDDLANARGLGGSKMTVLAQINTNTSLEDFARLYSTQPSASRNGVSVNIRDRDDTIQPVLRDSSGVVAPQIPFTQPTNGFLQVGFRYDGQSVDTIKDGVIVDSTPATVSPPRNVGVIGAVGDKTAVTHFGGIIDSLRLYDTPLSDSQIAEYNQNTSP